MSVFTSGSGNTVTIGHLGCCLTRCADCLPSQLPSPVSSDSSFSPSSASTATTRKKKAVKTGAKPKQCTLRPKTETAVVTVPKLLWYGNCPLYDKSTSVRTLNTVLTNCFVSKHKEEWVTQKVRSYDAEIESKLNSPEDTVVICHTA